MSLSNSYVSLNLSPIGVVDTDEHVTDEHTCHVFGRP